MATIGMRLPDSGSNPRICAVARSPSNTGIWTSIRMMSNSPPLLRHVSTASAPLLTSVAA